MRDGRDDNIAGQVTVSVTVAAYASMLPVLPDDPVMNAEKAPDCDAVAQEDAADPEDQMCTE
jgi:hypothetical protein